MSAQKFFATASFLVLGSLGSMTLAYASGPAQPLTADQKAQALNAFQSAAIASAAVNTLNPDMVPGTAPGIDPASQKFVQMSQLLQSAVQAGSCTVTSNHTTDAHGMIVGSSFSVTGASCLVSYDLESASPPNVDGTSSSKYTSNTPSYSALNDIDFLQVDSTTHLAGGPGNSLVLTTQGKGYTHSQLEGDLALPVSESGSGQLYPNQGSTFQLTLDVQFPAFLAELVMTSQSNASGSVVNYALNGELLTTDEILTYIAPPFAPHPANRGANSGFAELSKF